MPYSATVYRVMIASPSDVNDERGIIRDIVTEWNVLNSLIHRRVLEAVGWDTHVPPEQGADAQDFINTYILSSSDLLVGVFWTRFGTETREYAAGTVEEIERHRAKGKPLLLYFSDVPVPPSQTASSDWEHQYKRVVQFRQQCKGKGLYYQYSSRDQFKDHFRIHLQQVINQHPHFAISERTDSLSSKTLALSIEAQALLMALVKSSDGRMFYNDHRDHLVIEINDKRFVDVSEPRPRAFFLAAVQELKAAFLITPLGDLGKYFELTREGFLVAEKLLNEKPDDQRT